MSSAIKASFSDVIEALHGAIRPLERPPAEVPLMEAEGRFLAEDISSRFDFPLFDNSAMDGYAVRTADFAGAGDEVLTLCVAAEITAGHPYDGSVPAGASVRIMTGAKLPDGFDAVIPIEKTIPGSGTVDFAPGLLKAGTNVRRRGEIFRTGEVLLHRGTLLNKGHIGLAASLGRGTLRCLPKLTAAVFSSGDELVEPSDGAPLGEGRIYNANGTYVTLLARSLGIDARYMGILPDDPNEIERRFRETAGSFDIVICSGGVGPGDCDFTAAVLNRLAVLHHYHVAMRPGKPFSFGYFNETDTLILGLPGNPVAAANAGSHFIEAASETLLGTARPSGTLQVRVAGRIKSRLGRQDFVRGTISQSEDGRLDFHPGSQQSSSSLLGVARGNAVLTVPADRDLLTEGDLAEARYTD